MSVYWGGQFIIENLTTKHITPQPTTTQHKSWSLQQRVFSTTNQLTNYKPIIPYNATPYQHKLNQRKSFQHKDVTYHTKPHNHSINNMPTSLIQTNSTQKQSHNTPRNQSTNNQPTSPNYSSQSKCKTMKRHANQQSTIKLLNQQQDIFPQST